MRPRRVTVAGHKIIRTQSHSPRHRLHDVLLKIKPFGVNERWFVISLEMDGTETVTVPAGTFSNCLKVTYATWKMSGMTATTTGNLLVTDGNVRDTCWFAKDVGVVKEVQVKTTIYSTGQGSAMTREELTKVLKSYTPVK